MNHFPEVIAAWLFVVGLYGIVTSRHLVHLVMCLGIIQAGTYLLLIAGGYRFPPAAAPIFETAEQTTLTSVDPIVQALTLTDIVVGAAVTALLLAITIQIHKSTGNLDPQELRLMHRP